LNDFDESLLFDPMVAHSPLEDLVGMASREFNEEEALFGSVGSASSAFDLYSQQNKPQRSANPANPAVVNKSSNAEYISDFLMEDELNLSDPTKSSWRREVVIESSFVLQSSNHNFLLLMTVADTFESSKHKTSSNRPILGHELKPHVSQISQI